MYRILEEFDIPIEFYVPLNESAEEFENLISGQSSGLRVAHRESGIKPSWVALAAVLKVLEKEPYRNPVGQVMFQKIAYFATMSGLPTGLQYKRGSYGPFARGLKGIITRMVNNGLIEEHKHGRLFEVRVGTSYIVARKRFLNDLMKWRAIIEHVADLFMRVNTKQSEIMASVHMAAQDVRERTNRKPTADEVTNEVMLWKQKRRPPLSEKEVKHTVAVLAILDWIDIDAGQGWFIDEPELT